MGCLRVETAKEDPRKTVVQYGVQLVLKAFWGREGLPIKTS